MTSRLQDGAYWHLLNTEVNLSFGMIAERERIAGREDVTLNVVAGAIYRYRKKNGIPAGKSPIDIKTKPSENA